MFNRPLVNNTDNNGGNTPEAVTVFTKQPVNFYDFSSVAIIYANSAFISVKSVQKDMDIIRDELWRATDKAGYNWRFLERKYARQADLWVEISPLDLDRIDSGAAAASLAGSVAAGLLLGPLASSVTSLATQDDRAMNMTCQYNIGVRFFNRKTGKNIGSISVSSGRCKSEEECVKVLADNILKFMVSCAVMDAGLPE